MRIFALVYNPFLWLGEIAGMRNLRRAVLGNAHGRVVEIGAGTGLNIAHYPDEIADLVLTEPDASMRRRLTRRLQRNGRVARIVDAPAERLPLADASVDTVVSTLVLCTVPDPERHSGRDSTRTPPRRAVAVPRTRARELAVPRGVPGLPVPSVAWLRRRVLLQPPDRGPHARQRVYCRSRRQRVARYACHRPSAHCRAGDSVTCAVAG